MPRLAGHVAVVTGAAQGIGAAIAREFVAEGARVVAVDVRTEGLEELARGREDSIICRQCDISDLEAYRRCIEESAAHLGRLDTLVSNAAVIAHAHIFDATAADWQRIQDVNLRAVWWGAKVAAPIMARRQRGRIINISSLQAFMTDGRVGAYCATKGGINSLTHSLAVELAPYGILANTIAPGYIQTPMSALGSGVDETTTPEFKAWYIERRKIPLARPGRPEEIARAAVFLASDDSSYMTGQVMLVDGGMSITF
jgi:NAD(P)-dependent dehydrogenase (short-subunit alcohol dehydrogenase family)